MPREGTKAINVTVSDALYQRIKTLAEREVRTVTQQVQYMLGQWWDHEEERGEMLERIERLEASQREPLSNGKAV